MTITESLQNHIHSEKCAIYCDGIKITYPQLYKKVTELKHKLSTVLHIPQKKKVAFLLPNDHEFMIVFLAICDLGAVAIPLDPKWSDKDLAHIIADCCPDLIITNQHRFLPSHKTMTLTALYQEENSMIPFPPVSKNRIFYIGYTSGTTGKPKGYLRTHHSWLQSFQSIDQVFQISMMDQVLSPGPLVHSHFLIAALHTLYTGATLYIMKKFEPKSLLQLIKEQHISVMYLVPTMFAAIYEQDHSNKRTSLTKIISAGAKWHPILREHATTLFPHAEVFEYYGASELSFVTVLDQQGYQVNPLSVGKPFPHVSVSIRRPDGTEAKIGEIGQLFVKSDLIFSGYLNNPQATSEVIQGEWATVGDLAVRDEHGYITLVGRKNHMLISGGLNVYPEEVERVLAAHPAIAEVAVLGVKDAYWGDKITAIIKWKDGQYETSAALKSFCKQSLATYKCPQIFLSIQQFPYTSSGKIARKQLFTIVENMMKEGAPL